MTSRELVLRTLEFRNTDGRVPRDLWTLPWAWDRYGDRINGLLKDFPMDFGGPQTIYAKKTIEQGDSCAVGEYIDAWGCKFQNIHAGVIGEVKQPQVQDDDWLDAGKVHFPEEWLSFEIAQVNEACRAAGDKFLMSPNIARPFEQLQFIRGTANLYMDLMDPPKAMLEFM